MTVFYSEYSYDEDESAEFILVLMKCIFWKKFSGIDKWSKITIPL